MKKPLKWALWIYGAIILGGMVILSLSGCLSFGSGEQESVIDRQQEACEMRDGEWTELGCLFHLPLDIEPAPAP